MSFAYTKTGFAALGALPNIGSPEDWIAWHFSDVRNLPLIAHSNALVCHSAGLPHVDLADAEIKRDRLSRPIDLPAPYPPSAVGDHVPFYFASRSPMLFRVANETHAQGGLVFFGVRLGDVADSAIWCATDGNARSGLTQFTCDLAHVAEVVDFRALTTKYWRDAEDTDLKRRRQAELLVHEQVPLELIRYVVCKTDETMSVVQGTLPPRGGTIGYHVLSQLYFTEVSDDR